MVVGPVRLGTWEVNRREDPATVRGEKKETRTVLPKQWPKPVVVVVKKAPQRRHPGRCSQSGGPKPRWWWWW